MSTKIAVAETKEEKEAILALRSQYFLNPSAISFEEKKHIHIVFYEDNQIAGCADFEFLPHKRAILRVLIIDEPRRYQGLGKYFLQLCEQWLINLNIRTLYLHSTLEARAFYLKFGFKPMSFETAKPNEVELGKILG